MAKIKMSQDKTQGYITFLESQHLEMEKDG